MKPTVLLGLLMRFKSDMVKTFSESESTSITDFNPGPEIRVVVLVPEPRIAKLTWRLMVILFEIMQVPGWIETRSPSRARIQAFDMLKKSQGTLYVADTPGRVRKKDKTRQPTILGKKCMFISILLSAILIPNQQGD